MDARERFKSRGRLSLIERKFIAQVLAEEGREIERLQTKAINRALVKRSGHLLEDRSFDVSDNELEIRFRHYLRFQDMRNKSYIYNRIMFARFNAIKLRLMYGFTDEIKKQLAAEYNIPIDG